MRAVEKVKLDEIRPVATDIERFQRRQVPVATTLELTLCHDQEIWNSAVVGLGGSLYQSWQWGEVRRTQGWYPWRMLATDAGIALAAAQILEHRVPLLGSLLYGTHGIVCANVKYLAPFLACLRELATERKAILLRLDPSVPDGNSEEKEILLQCGLLTRTDQWSKWSLPRATMIVDLQSSEQELLHNMRRKHREHISRAQRSGLEFREGVGSEELHDFYLLLCRSSERQGFSVRNYSYFESVRQHLLLRERGRIFLALDHGVPLAGILCSIFGKTAYYLYGGFDYSARQFHPNEHLHFTAFKWAKANGCDSYNMTGAGTTIPPREGNRGFGLYNFKKGFDAKLFYSAGYFDLIGNRISAGLFRLAERQFDRLSCMVPCTRIVGAVHRLTAARSNGANQTA